MKQLCVGVGIASVGVVLSAQAPAPVADEVLRLERAEVEATVKKDRAAIERLYADDYSYVHSTGAVATKAQELSDVPSADVKWTGFTQSEMKARVYGDAAIVTGVETLQGTAKGYVPGARRVTDVWLKRNGRWQMIAGQSTVVSKDSSATAARSAVKTLAAKTVATSGAQERAVMQADESHARAELANDDAKQRALETKDYSFVSRLGLVASVNDPAPTPNKSLMTAYDRIRVYGTLAVVQGSLVWTDVKGFSPGVLRFTRVWIKEGTAWKLAAEQRTPIAVARPTT
jgi:ketosteroid isomerase-like protein